MLHASLHFFDIYLSPRSLRQSNTLVDFRGPSCTSPAVPLPKKGFCPSAFSSSFFFRAACPNVGVLGRRVAAHVCREVGGRVSVNVAVRDLDIGVLDEADARRLEVVVDGLPLFLGWTPLSCLCCAGTGHLTLGVQTKMEQVWQLLAAARKRAVLNWLVNTGAPDGLRQGSWWARGVSSISLHVGQGQGAQ